jgi:hypothetical protein
MLAGSFLLAAGPALAHIAEGTVPLTVAEEFPAPTGVSASAGGSATFELQDDMTLTYDVTVHDLTGPALFAHIHEGAAGTAPPNNIVFTFLKMSDTEFKGTTAALTTEQVGKLLSGAYYANVHTGMNLGGEIRGQITTVEAVKGTCSCQTLSRQDFRKCVKGEIKKLDNTQKKSAEIRALKKAVKKSSCGLSATPKKKPLACCLPANDVAGIVTGELCAPVKKDAQCTALGGTVVQGSGCAPTNPCSPPASPSGAFLE